MSTKKKPTTRLTVARRDMLLHKLHTDMKTKTEPLIKARDKAADHLERVLWGDQHHALRQIRDQLELFAANAVTTPRGDRLYVQSSSSFIAPADYDDTPSAKAAFEAYIDANNAVDEEHHKIDDIVGDVRDALRSVRTVEAAFERFPVLKKYEAAVGMEEAPANLAPAYADINAKLEKALSSE